MPSAVSILLYGRDDRLLESRQWVLERAGYRVRATTQFAVLDEMTLIAPVDLLLLCHTVPSEDCGAALTIAYLRCSHLRSLVLTAGDQQCSTIADAVLDAREGPKKLVSTIGEIFSPSRNSSFSRAKLSAKGGDQVDYSVV